MPLVILNERLYLYKKGTVYLHDKNGYSRVDDLWLRSWKDISRVTVRLFRREPKCAVSIDEDKILIAGQKKIFLLNVKYKEVKVIAYSREKFSDPLNICVTSGKWLALWGDYGPNAEHDEIYVYGLTAELKVERIYKFEAGSVRHIHNIVAKQSGDGYYIFTGDREDTAGIYESDNQFQTVMQRKTGEQRYRAVAGFDTKKGLLYATDAVNHKNYIYILGGGGVEPKSICSLNGSCIYGASFSKGYLFSTTVEPDENRSGVLSWFSRRRGAGILTDQVELIYVDYNLKCRVLERYKKDLWPMKLMQYGKIMFPHGMKDTVWIYPVGVKKYDGKTVEMDVDGKDLVG